MKNIKTFKIVMLSTEKSNITLGIGSNSTKDKLHFSKITFDKGKNNQPQHLYIISDDEIKEGDYHIAMKIKDSNPHQCIAYTDKEQLEAIKEIGGAKKIIATTDKLGIGEKEIKPGFTMQKRMPIIPESFIQAYIKAYNEDKPITEVDLEMFDEGKALDINSDSPLTIKTRPDNTVIVHQSKMYTRDEVENLMMQSWIKGQSLPHSHYTIRENWIEETLKNQ